MSFDIAEQQLLSLLQAALDEPEQADCRYLWEILEVVLSPLSMPEQLRVAGLAIEHISEILLRRCDQMMMEWRDRDRALRGEEPILDLQAISNLFRQSMKMELEDYLEPTLPQTRQPRAQGGELSAQEIQAQVVEAIAETERSIALESTLAIAHQENVSSWVAQLSHHLSTVDLEQPVNLYALHTSLKMPLVEIWLGLLLGSYHLQQDQFYSAVIHIQLPDRV